MKTLVDARLRDEAERYGLRFGCEDCAHFAPTRETCTHGYPTAPHRRERLLMASELFFCKEFELGAGDLP